MKPVYQTKFGKWKGNCFPAVISSLLDIPLDSIPAFCGTNSGDWYGDFTWWLSDYGYTSVEFCIGITWKPAEGQLCYLVGPSPRGNFGHCVVGRYENGEYIMIHDPHPCGDGLVSVELVGFFIPIVPHGKEVTE